jgi:hypothetical protein
VVDEINASTKGMCVDKSRPAGKRSEGLQSPDHAKAAWVIRMTQVFLSLHFNFFKLYNTKYFLSVGGKLAITEWETQFHHYYQGAVAERSKAQR